MSRTTFATARQSFERYAKRNGLATAEESAISAEQLEKFRGCKFWIWDKDKHRQEYKRTQGRCCFNHMLPFLPTKNGKEMPFFPWQREIFTSLENDRLIAILKGRGTGGTEALIRWAFYLMVKDDKMRGKVMCVITGIREDLSIELVRRFKNLMPDLKWNTRENLAELRGCRLIGFPSKRVKDLRGLADVALVICDEFDHFDPNDQIQVLPILEAFQVKADVTVCLLSTPGPIGSEMNKLFDLPENECRYKRLFVPIQKATGTLISEEEAAKARASPNYLQEFELRFSSHAAGSMFSLADIDKAVQLGKEFYSKQNLDLNAVKSFYIGVDPSGLSISKHALTVIALLDKIHVLICEEYSSSQITEDDFMKHILTLRSKLPYSNKVPIFIDSSNISFIKRLKGMIPNEVVEYQQHIKYLEKHRWITPPDYTELVNFLQVIPISFSKHGVGMLASLFAFLQRGDIIIHPRCVKTLVPALQSARSAANNKNTNFVLDKSSQSLDALDSLRLACYNLDAGIPVYNEEEELEEEDIIEEEETEDEITV